VAATGVARGALATVWFTAGTTRATGAGQTTGGTEVAAMAAAGAVGRSTYAVVTPVSSEAVVATAIPTVTILPSGFMVCVPPFVDWDGHDQARIPARPTGALQLLEPAAGIHDSARMPHPWARR